MNVLDARFVLLLAISVSRISSEEVPITLKTSHLEVMERISERTASLQSWSADFRQVRMASLLKDPVLSTGKLHVLQPGRLRWDQYSPAKSVMTFNDQKVLVYTPDKKIAHSYSLSKRFSPQHIFIPGPEWLKRIKKYFDGEVTEVTETSVTLKVVPKKKRLKKVLSSVTIQANRRTWLMELIKVERTEEDYVKVYLSKHDLANNLTPPFFEYQPPAGTEIKKVEEVEDLFADIVGK
jgi:outer membrane lipoprotein-sorting protein